MRRWVLVLRGANVLPLGAWLGVLLAHSYAEEAPLAEGRVQWAFHAASGQKFGSDTNDGSTVVTVSDALHSFYRLANGVGVVYWRNGQQYISCTVSNGMLTGAWSAFYSNGQKSVSGTYDAHGARDSRWTTWYESGRKSTESYYRGGVPSGLWCTWHTNGSIGSACAYVNGVAEGKSLAWDPAGAIIRDAWAGDPWRPRRWPRHLEFLGDLLDKDAP